MTIKHDYKILTTLAEIATLFTPNAGLPRTNMA